MPGFGFPAMGGRGAGATPICLHRVSRGVVRFSVIGSASLIRCKHMMLPQNGFRRNEWASCRCPVVISEILGVLIVLNETPPRSSSNKISRDLGNEGQGQLAEVTLKQAGDERLDVAAVDELCTKLTSPLARSVSGSFGES